MEEDQILIGEGVHLDVRPASFASRLVAAVLDVLVLGMVLWVLAIVTFSVTPVLDDALATAAGIVLMVTILVGVPTTVETLTRGRSVGKIAMGLRIVRADGGPVRFRQALVRAVVGIVELWLTLGSVALLTSLLDRKGRRLGDVFAGTYAIRARGGQQALAPIQMPPELAAWARSADIRRLPDGVALRARQFLGRNQSLNPASRARLGLQLAALVEPHVAPGPPLGTHPERFLAAVLAERRDRELDRARRVQEVAEAEAELLHRLPHAIPDPVN